MPHAPDTLPDALPHDAGSLRPPPPYLFLQDGHAVIHLLAAELRAVAAGPPDDVGVARAEELGHELVLLGGAGSRGDARGEEELPEEVGGVGVGVARAGGLDARVEADEEDEEVGRYGVPEGWQVCVGGWRGVGGALAFALPWGGGGGR